MLDPDPDDDQDDDYAYPDHEFYEDWNKYFEDETDEEDEFTSD